MVRYNIIKNWPTTDLYIDQPETVDIPQSIKDSLRKFRFARRSAGSAALVIKINKEKLVMEEVEQFDDITIEELADGMYEQNLNTYARGSIFLTTRTLFALGQNFPKILLDTSCSLTSSSMRMEGYHFL
jgi:hypothetical protein